jgi:NAD(P)H dehydrogenase (quinone)
MAKRKPKILVLFYSMHGHTFIMAKNVAAGISAAGGEAVLKQAQEVIPEEKWDEDIARAKEEMQHIPVADPKKDLKGIDGLILGTPTRFGNMCAQIRNFWDQTTEDWMAGTLVGKPAAVFTSTATQHGGQETTIIASMLTLLHHGCIIAGLPYIFHEQMTMTEISGGSPYGASTISGTAGERFATKNELLLANHQGSHLTEIAKKLLNSNNDHRCS